MLAANAAFSLPAQAQTAPGAAASGNNAPPEQHLLGAWGDLPTDLRHDGVDLSVEYAGQVPADDFLNTAVCGCPHSLPAKVGFNAGGRSGFDREASGRTETDVPVQVGYEPTVAPQTLPGHYKPAPRKTRPTNLMGCATHPANGLSRLPAP